MVRINEEISFDCETNAFFIDKDNRFEENLSIMKIVWLLLLVAYLILFLLVWSVLSPRIDIFLKLMVLLAIPFITVLIYKMIGLNKALHIGEVSLFRNRNSDDEDVFIYVFERNSHLIFEANKAPSFPEAEISYKEILNILREKKSLILRYSLFMNLISVGSIIFILAVVGAHAEYPLVILPAFIPIFLYWITLTTLGYSPIKSYRFWTELENYIQAFETNFLSDKGKIPKLNYEEIHRQILEENKKIENNMRNKK